MNQKLAQSIPPLFSALPVEPYQTISQYAQIGDQLAVTAAGRIQPLDPDGLSKTDLPLMIGGKWLSPEHLAKIGKHLLVADVCCDALCRSRRSTTNQHFPATRTNRPHGPVDGVDQPRRAGRALGNRPRHPSD